MGSLCYRRRINLTRNSVFQVALLTVIVIAGLLFLQWSSLSTVRKRASKELSGTGQNEVNPEYLVTDRFLEGEVKKKGKFSLINIKSYPDADKIASYLKNQIENGYILKPHQFKNEYHIPPFKLFTRSNLYNLETGLVKQPQLPVNFWRDINDDLNEVINSAANILDDPALSFSEGYYRTQHQVGTQFELVFRSTVNLSEPLHLVSLFRPYGPLHIVSSTVKKATETVYIIVPLHGRGDAFRNFMVNFETMAINGDGHVHLTVVCYGDEAVVEARKVLKETEEKTKFKSHQIIEGKPGGFARGRALQVGTEALPGNNPLMFFCDVDMFFTNQFLTQCRAQTRPGSRVFYPIVFSLYNPEIVYKRKPIPSLKDQQVIKRDNGFWRDFGFGMTCQYKSDFNNIGGFDLTIKGWGSEDVLLYRKYSRSNKYQVIRSPVNSLFHHWHPKHCDKALSLEQYNSCLRTRSLTEGSQVQLGMLYLENKAKS